MNWRVNTVPSESISFIFLTQTILMLCNLINLFTITDLNDNISIIKSLWPFSPNCGQTIYSFINTR